jgi:hydrogenase maturation protease
LRWIEGGTLGLELTHALDGVEYLLVLDAVAMQHAPGTVARYAGDSLYQLPAGRSVHLMGLSDLLAAIQLLGDPPRETILLGVEPASTEWGLQLSAEVTAALPLLMRVAEKQILAWMDAPSGERRKDLREADKERRSPQAAVLS